MIDVDIDSSGLLEEYSLEIGIANLIISLLDKMDLEMLADKCEIPAARLEKLLALDGNPTLAEIKRLARIAEKRAMLSFAPLFQE